MNIIPTTTTESQPRSESLRQKVYRVLEVHHTGDRLSRVVDIVGATLATGARTHGHVGAAVRAGEGGTPSLHSPALVGVPGWAVDRGALAAEARGRSMGRPTTSLPHVLFGAYVVVCIVSLVWPVYAWVGERVEPRPLGLPLGFLWNIGWIVLTFIALWLYDRAVGRRP